MMSGRNTHRIAAVRSWAQDGYYELSGLAERWLNHPSRHNEADPRSLRVAGDVASLERNRDPKAWLSHQRERTGHS